MLKEKLLKLQVFLYLQKTEQYTYPESQSLNIMLKDSNILLVATIRENEIVEPTVSLYAFSS